MVRDYIDDVKWGGYRGDASWLAAPHLRYARLDRVKVIHIVRDPLETISSMLSTGFYAIPDDEYLEEWWPYRLYQEEFLFNGELAPEWGDLTPLERAMTMYVKWNRMVDDSFDMRYRLEDLIHADAVKEMLANLGYQRDFDECSAVIKSTPITNKGIDHPVLTWNDLPDSDLKVQLRQMASDYGYLEESAHVRNDQQP